MRNRSILSVFPIVLVLVSALAATPARADGSVRREAPYDFGCTSSSSSPNGANCSALETAKLGLLDAAVTLGPAIVYGPPFVWFGWYAHTSFAGIDLRFTETTRLDVTASVRTAGAAAGTVAPLVRRSNACVFVFQTGGYAPLKQTCDEMTGTTSQSIRLEAPTLAAGRYKVIVAPQVSGLEGAAALVVESITYASS